MSWSLNGLVWLLIDLSLLVRKLQNAFPANSRFCLVLEALSKESRYFDMDSWLSGKSLVSRNLNIFLCLMPGLRLSLELPSFQTDISQIRLSEMG